MNRPARHPDKRFRVFVDGKFACVVSAPSATAARAAVLASVEVREVRA